MGLGYRVWGFMGLGSTALGYRLVIGSIGVRVKGLSPRGEDLKFRRPPTGTVLKGLVGSDGG